MEPRLPANVADSLCALSCYSVAVLLIVGHLLQSDPFLRLSVASPRYLIWSRSGSLPERLPSLNQCMIPEFPLPDEADLLHSVLRPPIYAEYSASKLLPPALRPDLSTGWSFFKSIEVSPIKIVPAGVSTRKVAASAPVSMRSFSVSPLASIMSAVANKSPFRLLAA